MWTRQLINPTEEEIETCTTILVEALGSNPFLRATADWNEDVMRKIMRGRLEVMVKDEWAWVAGSGEEGSEIEGVTVINGKGYAFGTSKTVPEGPPKFRELIRPETVEWHISTYGPWFTDFCNRAFPGGTAASIWVNLLAVSPRVQGKGLGKALINVLVEEARREQVPLILGTQKLENVKFYEKHGFKVCLFEEVNLKGEICPSWGMMRDVD
ncbi:hypothetical protein BCR39DRAFT_524094 [Naematelia encephala]|uniref:N-acetyltransferase domain-containing protein n=1 Tax=Naematelia encephala TaxID=71784 RepID=A0A1Y2BB56_9TREE|nr:hypothetical protein BCR39DRAFT_524094 [Naematelia encephala]